MIIIFLISNVGLKNLKETKIELLKKEIFGYNRL